MEHQYTAKQIDVEQRRRLIEMWEERGKDFNIKKPEPIELGDCIKRSHVIPSRGIYWSKGLKIDANGEIYGGGIHVF